LVVVALSYHGDGPRGGRDGVAPAAAPRGTVARYARGADYHPVMWEKLNALGAWIGETFGPEVRWRGFADSGPLRERELAARAGLGWQGKHTNLISLDLGTGSFWAPS
jgi:epoxyqueuosine reductase